MGAEKKISDVAVMQTMVAEDNKGLKCSTTMVGMNLKKKGGEVTMGIDTETYHKLSKSTVFQTGEQACLMFVVDMKEFNKTKKKMQEFGGITKEEAERRGKARSYDDIERKMIEFVNNPPKDGLIDIGRWILNEFGYG